MLVDQNGNFVGQILDTASSQLAITKPVPVNNFQMYANNTNTPNTPIVTNPNVVQANRTNVIQPDRINVVNPQAKYKHGGEVEILKGHDYIKDLL